VEAAGGKLFEEVLLFAAASGVPSEDGHVFQDDVVATLERFRQVEPHRLGAEVLERGLGDVVLYFVRYLFDF